MADERAFMNGVYGWMAGGLAITAAMAWYFASSGAITMLYNQTGGMSMLGWVVTLGPLGFILAMNFGIQRLSASGLALLFVAFSATMGASLSSIFLVYSMGSLTQVFGITAGTFLVMSVIGYTTSTDLSRFGSILMMALIGILIAMLVNWFLASSALDYLISIGGVLIFTGLIAYDTQKLKRIAAGVEYGSEHGRKLALLGATSLYLDFINLFLFLLRLLGRRD
jgi:FtsH-binding integral membrane protein